MKKLISVITIVAVAMMTTPTISSASLAKGQKLYKKKLRKFIGEFITDDFVEGLMATRDKRRPRFK